MQLNYIIVSGFTVYHVPSQDRQTHEVLLHESFCISYSASRTPVSYQGIQYIFYQISCRQCEISLVCKAYLFPTRQILTSLDVLL